MTKLVFISFSDKAPLCYFINNEIKREEEESVAGLPEQEKAKAKKSALGDASRAEVAQMLMNFIKKI